VELTLERGRWGIDLRERERERERWRSYLSERERERGGPRQKMLGI
jgi:hypothetical protein